MPPNIGYKMASFTVEVYHLGKNPASASLFQWGMSLAGSAQAADEVLARVEIAASTQSGAITLLGTATVLADTNSVNQNGGAPDWR